MHIQTGFAELDALLQVLHSLPKTIDDTSSFGLHRVPVIRNGCRPKWTCRKFVSINSPEHQGLHVECVEVGRTISLASGYSFNIPVC